MDIVPKAINWFKVCANYKREGIVHSWLISHKKRGAFVHA